MFCVVIDNFYRTLDGGVGLLYLYCCTVKSNPLKPGFVSLYIVLYCIVLHCERSEM